MQIQKKNVKILHKIINENIQEVSKINCVYFSLRHERH